ncbi:replication protein, partial [Mycolicibacterium smegmatis]|uniref:replication protein n=1 Tax=Mycolicibacterium smegmatis TaxID=1772 RepID=UPI0023D9FB58
MDEYPESAPENWQELLSETFMQFAVSPLHDKDINPDGEIKKPHWHVILIWDGPVTQNAAMKIAEKVNSPQPVKLESVRGAYRYFTHMDNPEKYQYDEKDIKLFNGFDISSYVSLTKEEKYEAIGKIMDIINENGITEYIDLLNILR